MKLNPAILEQLRASLRRLALAPAEQIQALDSQGAPVDELALEFDDVAEAVAESEWLTPEGAAAIRRLDQYLNEMSGRTRAELWTEDALYNAPEWEHVRILAERALQLVPTPPR